MHVVSQLASSLDRRDEEPNIALAEKLASEGDTASIAILVDLLSTGTKALKHDAIKTLYETAERRPELLAPHVDTFLEVLRSKDNRMVWGAMSALAALAAVTPEKLMSEINAILEIADRASVISKDKAMALLATLNSDPRYHDILMPVIFTRLANAATNQTPMYAELTAPSLLQDDIPRFEEIVRTRIAEIPQPAKKARLEKLLRKLGKR